VDKTAETCRAGLDDFFTATVLLVLGGAAVAAVSSPPVKYDEFNSLPVTFLISSASGLPPVWQTSTTWATAR
jgi:hypothetical protein